MPYSAVAAFNALFLQCIETSDISLAGDKMKPD
jgi:hypothetical protein